MPVNILVADDSATMRRIMELTFAGEEAKVVSVNSGDAAVAKAQELKPDVVFADASMSGMDGYGLAAAIKATAGLENAAVIVMASQKHPYDEGKAKAAGVDDHILKPFDSQHVIDRVNQVLSKPRAKAAGGAAAAAPPPPAARPAPPPVAAPPTPAASRAPQSGGTMVFEPKLTPAHPQPAVRAAAPAAPAPAPAPARPAVAAAATASNGDLAQKLGALGLNAAQVDGVLALSRDVIEQVVWEVVPELAETIIKEEIRRLTS